MSLVVRPLLFAACRGLAGASSLEVRLPDGATVNDLVTALRTRGGPSRSCRRSRPLP